MLILIHVVLAITSIAIAVYNNFRPSNYKLKQSYIFALETLATGVLLIIVNNASVLRTCLTGIVFFCFVSLLNETARHKLARETKIF
jgi:hypothetical protein